MFKNLIKELEDLRFRRISLAQCLILSPVVIIGFALIYMVTVPGERADANYPVPHYRAGVRVNEARKPVILQWMKERSEMPEQVLSKVYNTAMNSVNADLILAVCLVESNFNPHVESKKGAIGLMGIMPDVWLEELQKQGIVRGQADLYTISGNMNAGIYVLESYMARTNNLRKALSRYAGGDPAYAARVLRMIGEISRVRSSQDLPRFEALRTKA